MRIIRKLKCVHVVAGLAMLLVTSITGCLIANNVEHTAALLNPYHNFGNVFPLGTIKSYDIEIQNFYEYPIKFQGIQLNQIDETQMYSFVNHCPIAPTPLASKAKCKITVQYKPENTGTHRARLVLDVVNHAPMSILLSGFHRPDLCENSLTYPHDKTLLIRDISVVENSRATHHGPWTFSKILHEINTSELSTSDFIKSWLNQWITVTDFEGNPVTPRPMVQQLIDSWPKLANGDLDLTQDPLRLLAIVNRLDLSEPLVRLGELRFVYGFYDATGAPIPFTVNIEINILPFQDFDDVDWAISWFDLGKLPFGEEYNQKLQKITDAIAKKGPSGFVHLAQLRTNESALGAPQEFREFYANFVGNGEMFLAQLQDTPDISFNSGEKADILVDWLNNNSDKVFNHERFPNQIHSGSTPFLAGQAPIVPGFKWLVGHPGISEELRRSFSMNTCQGCHAGETNNPTLFHIQSRNAGQVAPASNFLISDLSRRETYIQEKLTPFLHCQ